MNSAVARAGERPSGANRACEGRRERSERRGWGGV